MMGDIGRLLADCLLSLHKGKVTIYDYMPNDQDLPFAAHFTKQTHSPTSRRRPQLDQ